MPDEQRTAIKNRIISSGMMKLDSILYNPQNWRIHPTEQQIALATVLAKVGWVQNVIVNIRTGNLIDGHLRVHLAAKQGETEIPVNYVDLSPDEELLILSTLDPIGEMARADKNKLQEVLNLISQEDQELQKLLDQVGEQYKLSIDESNESGITLDLINLGFEIPEHIVAKGEVYRLGAVSYFICASPLNDIEIWKPYLNMVSKFIPYATPFSLFSETLENYTVLALQPEPIIAGFILDRLIEVRGVGYVNQL